MRLICHITFALLISLSFSFTTEDKPTPAPNPKAIPIQWTDLLTGNFHFTQQWSYPAGVEMKADGKAGCADGGFAPERCMNMLGEDGIVLKDSAAVFYQLLDTTHLFHTLSCTASCYEWDGSDFMHVMRNGDSLVCRTQTGVSTHSSLHLLIKGDTCYPTVRLTSIVRGESAVFYPSGGHIIVDKTAMKSGMLKAEFDFHFVNTKDADKPIFFKGNICAPVQAN